MKGWNMFYLTPHTNRKVPSCKTVQKNDVIVVHVECVQIQ